MTYGLDMTAHAENHRLEEREREQISAERGENIYQRDLGLRGHAMSHYHLPSCYVLT